MKTYRVTLFGMALDTTVCPPSIVSALWPSYNGWLVSMNPAECLVTVPDFAPAPADLGPLVKVELVSE